MAEISKITLPSGSSYDLKDAVARDAIGRLNSFEYKVCTSVSDTPQGVTWKSGSTTITGTLVASSSTLNKIYLVPSENGTKDIFDEYITVNTTGSTYVWEMFGNTDVHLSDLGALAKKNSASGSYTPEGTVSQPTFTGTEKSVSVSGTPSGTISVGSGTANYTPSGTVSAPTIHVTPSTVTKYVASSTTGGGSVTAGTPASCTLPNLQMNVSNETLSMSWTPGSFSANTPTSVTLPSFASQSIATGISSATADAPTFTGSGAELKFTGSQLTSSGSYTPEGTVSQPGFTGTAKNVTVS